MGYSQKQVAWLLGHKNTSTVCRWEKGVAMPSVENLLRLSYIYRTLSDQLYFDLSVEFRQQLHEKEKQLQHMISELPKGP